MFIQGTSILGIGSVQPEMGGNGVEQGSDQLRVHACAKQVMDYDIEKEQPLSLQGRVDDPNATGDTYQRVNAIAKRMSEIAERMDEISSISRRELLRMDAIEKQMGPCAPAHADWEPLQKHLTQLLEEEGSLQYEMAVLTQTLDVLGDKIVAEQLQSGDCK